MSVLLCTWGDAVEGGTEEALTVLRRLARATDTTSAWLVLGPAGGQAGDLAVAGRDGARQRVTAVGGPAENYGKRKDRGVAGEGLLRGSA